MMIGVAKIIVMVVKMVVVVGKYSSLFDILHLFYFVILLFKLILLFFLLCYFSIIKRVVLALLDNTRLVVGKYNS